MENKPEGTTIPTNADTGKALSANEIRQTIVSASAEDAKKGEETVTTDNKDTTDTNKKDDETKTAEDKKTEEEDKDLIDSVFAEEKAEEDKEKEAKDFKKKKDQEEEEDQEQEDQIAEEDKKMISKVVEEKLKPYQEQARKAEIQKVELEFDRYVAENPELSKYKDNIKPYVSKLHSVFVKNGIKLEDGTKIKVPEAKYNDFVTAFVLGRGMLKIGARMKAGADQKAANDSQAAASYRKQETGGIPDIKNMSKEEFSKLTTSVKSGKFKV